MNTISLKEAERILDKELNEDLGFRPKLTKDFEWGTLFYVQSKEFIENSQNPYIGIAPRLVDKIDGSIHVIDGLGILDKQLEDYRESKGYPESIKFPVKKDLSKLSDIEKVFLLIETKEISQIEEAIEIVKEKKLFDLDGLKKICCAKEELSLVESLAIYFPSRGDYNLYKSKLERMPDEIALFRKRITGLWVSHSMLKEIPLSILMLDELKFIIIEQTPLEEIPYDWSKMKQLKEIVLEKTNIKITERSKFKLPKGCKLEILN